MSLSPSRPFILRPVATSLLMAAIMLAGYVGYMQPLTEISRVYDASKPNQDAAASFKLKPS